MTIRLEKMIPLPLLEQDIAGSGIWEVDSVLFETGKSYTVSAASGKGKTSLLSVIYGIRQDYHGEIYFGENNIRSYTTRTWSSVRKERLSYIFQGLELFDNLTALENIQLKNSITGYKSQEEIRGMAAKLNMEPYLNRKAGILSFGQQQRVAIIRALCQPFEFLLADECFSHMDQEISDSALQLIQSECDIQKAGLILTSLKRSAIMGPETQLEL